MIKLLRNKCNGRVPSSSKKLEIFGIPTYFIFGNHNLKEFGYYHRTSSSQDAYRPLESSTLAYAHGAHYLGFKTARTENNLLLAGASGSIRYNNGMNQYTDREMFLKLIMMIPSLLLNKLKYGRYQLFLFRQAFHQGYLLQRQERHYPEDQLL